jgi:hypothetical protein
MNHLTDDQIDDLLIGDAAAATSAHLASCSDCAARLAAAYEPLASFNAASLAWGERRSATLPLQLQPKPTGLFAGGRLRVAIGTAAAAAVALVLALPLLHHGSTKVTEYQAVSQPAPTQTVVPAPGTKPATAPTQSQTPEDQIARDNQLLEAIDRELATSETPANLLKMAGQQDANQSSPDVTHNE